MQGAEFHNSTMSKNLLSQPIKSLAVSFSFAVFAGLKQCAILFEEFGVRLWCLISINSMKMFTRNYIAYYSFSSSTLLIHYRPGPEIITHTQNPTTHTYTWSFLSKSIPSQFAHPLLKKITLDLFVLNKLYYHLLECIMCPSLLSWLAPCFHDNMY